MFDVGEGGGFFLFSASCMVSLISAAESCTKALMGSVLALRTAMDLSLAA